MKKLKYAGFTIAFQEVPDEVSLIFNVSGCPRNCEGCHSSFLQEYSGEYLSDDFDKVLQECASYITTVCFMGGEQNPEELMKLLQNAKHIGKKTCLYSGCDTVDEVASILEFLDYVKIGCYRHELGGLNSTITNQRFYVVQHDADIPYLSDITYKFWTNNMSKHNKG